MTVKKVGKLVNYIIKIINIYDIINILIPGHEALLTICIRRGY